MSIEPAVIVSVSGGKDSTATLLLALGSIHKRAVFPVFADTGHEHELTYEYLDYLERRLGIAIKRLKADFSAMWWQRRDYVRDKWPAKLRAGRPGSWSWKDDRSGDPDLPPPAEEFAPAETVDCEWSPAVRPLPGPEADFVVARALEVLDAGPTGNPFLDLCIIKGRFPSRRAQFCTQHLKRYPLDAYAAEMLAAHGAVESWQGVRADESPNRADLAEREEVPEGWTIVRPILRWTAAEVFAKIAAAGVEPNPLYKLGMNRVGCMPCINTSKDELWQISERWPGHIARVAHWEGLAAAARRCGQATFFHASDPAATPDIHSFVEWSKTTRGGRQFDLLKSMGVAPGCSSSYGLCDAGDQAA